MLFYTVTTAVRLMSSDLAAPAGSRDKQGGVRLVLIAQELDSPFWTEVKNGALAAAERYGAELQAWGTFGLSEQEFLSQIEIAIASKVDGIIVQGVDTEQFRRLAKLKATGSGIPVITVANDVPAGDSLRKTYVGSNQKEAGAMLARQLLSDMGFAGKVALLVDDREEYFQQLRLEGIRSVLAPYPSIKMEVAGSGRTRASAVKTVNDVLNRAPDTKAFIAVAADHASVIIQEVRKRSLVDNYFVYAFDDDPEATSLLQQGSVDAIVVQSPHSMGERSVELMIGWLNRTTLPLNVEGYYTDIHVMKAGDRR